MRNILTTTLEEIKQNSDDWFEWRTKGIGSSDVPSVLGISPWRTALQLWKEKKGIENSQRETTATMRGHELEPKARALYELQVGYDAPPAVVQSDEYPFMRASLDGWAKDQNRILEIKCPGQAVIELAKAGRAPSYYDAQIQYQLMLTGAEACDYVVFDGKEITIVEIKPNKESMDEIFQRVEEFWKLVENNTPPPLTDKDFKDFENKEILVKLSEFKFNERKLKELKLIQENLRQEIIKSMDHPKMQGNGVKVTKTQRAGTVDWKKVSKENKIDAEKYRKEPIIAYQFRIADNARDESI